MRTTVNWILTFMFILCISLSATFAWRWYVDNAWLNNFEIFGPKMFWKNQQQLMEHLFIISTLLAFIIAATAIVIKSARNRSMRH